MRQVVATANKVQASKTPAEVSVVWRVSSDPPGASVVRVSDGTILGTTPGGTKPAKPRAGRGAATAGGLSAAQPEAKPQRPTETYKSELQPIASSSKGTSKKNQKSQKGEKATRKPGQEAWGLRPRQR